MCSVWMGDARSLRNKSGQARLSRNPDCRACPASRFGFCAGLSLECRDCLATIARHDDVAAGDVVGEQGELAHRLIAITKGVMVLTRRSPVGSASVVGFRYPGELIMPHQHDFRWPVTIQALCPSQTCQIRFDELSSLSPHDKELANRLLEIAAEHMAESFQHVVTLAYKEVDQRLAWFLLDFAARTHGGRVPRQSMELPMTRSQIANYIGMRTETVCRALGRLKARKLVAVAERRKLKILDKRALVSLANGSRPRAVPDRPQT